MVIPRADSSSSNFVTAGDISSSPRTTTAHSKFSRNSREMMCHRSSAGGVVAPIWMRDQCRISASVTARSGNGPRTMKWLSPCTRIPTTAISRNEAWIGNRITDREMVYHLSQFGRYVEISVHLLIVERADSGRP